MLQRFLLLWLVLLSLIAWLWSAAVEGSDAWSFNPFTASKPYFPWLIAVAMLAIGWMLPRDEVRQVVRRWPAVLAGTALQYTFMPLAAYCVARLWGFEGELLLGVVLVGCVPGAMASNVLTLLARGNASYSVSLTTAATLLSPLAVPIALRVVLGVADIDDETLYKSAESLVWMVVVPVVAGHLLGRRFSQYEQQARRVGSTVANLVILWVIAAVVAVNQEVLASLTLSSGMLWALVAINLAGYSAGYLGGWGLRLPEPMRRALTLEIGMQNAGLGATLATQLFPQQETIALPPALYTFGCMLTGTIIAQWWARRETKDAAGRDAQLSSVDASEA